MVVSGVRACSENIRVILELDLLLDNPVHTQTIEHAVKLVTEAASQVCGEEKRHGHILTVNKARKLRKPFDTKKDYKITDL